MTFGQFSILPNLFKISSVQFPIWTINSQICVDVLIAIHLKFTVLSLLLFLSFGLVFFIFFFTMIMFIHLTVLLAFYVRTMELLKICFISFMGQKTGKS